MPFDDPPSPLPDQRATLLERAVLAACLMVLAVAVAMWIGVTNTLATNRVNGYKNRAVACALLATQPGRQLPAICLEKQIVPFYAPPSTPPGS